MQTLEPIPFINHMNFLTINFWSINQLNGSLRFVFTIAEAIKARNGAFRISQHVKNESTSLFLTNKIRVSLVPFFTAISNQRFVWNS